MPQTKAQKQQTLEKLQKNLESQKGFFFVDFQGINVKDLSVLRSQLKKAGAKLQVAKKTLLQKALKENNLPVDAKSLRGEVAAVFAKEDFLAPLKTIFSFAKAHESLKVLEGYADAQILSSAMLKEFASLPSKQELLARFVGSIAAPISGFANVLQGNIKGLIYLLANKAKA
ncbi:MAG: 50S ribosomal protein L10 [bacterium]|nr:50S ribosomal protein L10 [Candidatus Wildermuthbacteria bacterium]MDP2664561.1 50S ribosomal protein L10 [bacterium]